MKTPLKHMLLLMLCFTFAAGFAQSNKAKPNIFSQFPETISLSTETLSNSFTATKGKNITLAFSKEFTAAGTVSSNILKYGSLQTMTILLPGFNNAVFHLSRTSDAKKSLSYTGRIISNQSGDAYILRQDEKGNYELKKIQTDTVLQDCFIH